MAYRGKARTLFRPTSSIETLDRKVKILGTDAFRKIAALENQVGDMHVFIETLKHHVLELRQQSLVKDIQKAATQVLDPLPNPKRAAPTMEEATIASDPSPAAQRVRKKRPSHPPQNFHRMSVSVVIPPRERESAPDPPSQPPYDFPTWAAVDPPSADAVPALGNTPTPWQPNFESMDLILPDTPFSTQLPTCSSDFSMMLRMLDSQRAVRKRRADAELSRIQSAQVIRHNKLEASKLRTTLLEISLERERLGRS
ncbi:MAG: hypothetical protein Q9184_000279 [Pyrenodesmia sp. 2 TL-2023]